METGGASAEDLIDEALQPVAVDTSAESPVSTPSSQPVASDHLPAPALDLALLSNPQAQSLEDSQVKQVRGLQLSLLLLASLVHCQAQSSDTGD